MKVKQIFFVVLPLTLAASSILMPGLGSPVIDKGNKAIKFTLPPFEINLAETNDAPLISEKNRAIHLVSTNESTATGLSQTSKTQMDVPSEKIQPNLLAMLFDLKTEVTPGTSSSKNLQQNRPKQQTRPRSHLPVVPKVRALSKSSGIGGLSSGSGSGSKRGFNPDNDDSVDSTEDQEDLTEVASEPTEKDSNSENPAEFISEPSNNIPLILGLPSPLDGDVGNLDPDSPLNPFPPSEEEINPFIPPGLSPPTDQLSRPLQLPLSGGESGPIRASAPDSIPVPEPSTIILVGSGLVTLIFYKRRFRKS